MRSLLSTSWRVAALVAVVGVLHWIAVYVLRSPLAVPLLVAVALVWTVERRWLAVLLLAAGLELLTTLPPLVLTSATLVPWVVYRWRGRIELDISFSYGVLIATTCALQLLVVYIGQQVAYGEFPSLLGWPWGLVALTWIYMSVGAFLLSLGLQSAFPPETRGIVSLEGHRLKV